MSEQNPLFKDVWDALATLKELQARSQKDDQAIQNAVERLKERVKEATTFLDEIESPETVTQAVGYCRATFNQLEASPNEHSKDELDAIESALTALEDALAALLSNRESSDPQKEIEFLGRQAIALRAQTEEPATRLYESGSDPVRFLEYFIALTHAEIMRVRALQLTKQLPESGWDSSRK